MRAVNVTRLIRAYVKDHPLRNGASGDAFQSLGLKRTTFKLDFRTTSKPVQVLSLMDAHVVNNERCTCSSLIPRIIDTIFFRR